MKTADDEDNMDDDDDDSIDDDESVNSTFTIVQKRSRKDYHCLCSNEFIKGNFDQKTSLQCIGKCKKYWHNLCLEYKKNHFNRDKFVCPVCLYKRKTSSIRETDDKRKL